MKLYWIPPGRRMDGAHIYARHQSALKRQKSRKGPERSLKVQIPQEVYDTLAKEMEKLGK